MTRHPERTIRTPARLSGIGIHTGHPSSVVCLPAGPGAGVTFVRTDLPGAPVIRATLRTVSEMRRGISLGRDPAVRTVEHLLAAASGLGIANLRVEVHGEELPILDGSAAPYVAALQEAGIVEQDDRLQSLVPGAPLWVARDPAWILAVPSDHFRATYIVPLRQTRLPTLVADFDTRRQRFADDIAPARTWGFVHELDALRRAGLARGASADNALGIGPEGYTADPRFADEPARHKVLDLIGDLALLARPLDAHVIACGAGHTLHLELARRVAQELR